MRESRDRHRSRRAADLERLRAPPSIDAEGWPDQLSGGGDHQRQSPGRNDLLYNGWAYAFKVFTEVYGSVHCQRKWNNPSDRRDFDKAERDC
jgi:hypothetical protein